MIHATQRYAILTLLACLSWATAPSSAQVYTIEELPPVFTDAWLTRCHAIGDDGQVTAFSIDEMGYIDRLFYWDGAQWSGMSFESEFSGMSTDGRFVVVNRYLDDPPYAVVHDMVAGGHVSFPYYYIPYDVNNNMQVVGSWGMYDNGELITTGPGSPRALNDDKVVAGHEPSSSQAWLWMDGEVIWLPGSSITGVSDINEHNVVTANTGANPMILTEDSATTLPNLDGADVSLAHCINNRGQVVGHSGGWPGFAVLWQNGQIHNLNDLIDPTYENAFINALSINDKGQIVGYWHDSSGNPCPTAIILTPRCKADLNLDDELNSTDFIIFLSAYLGHDSFADYNTDLTVDSQDFIAYLNDFVAGCD